MISADGRHIEIHFTDKAEARATMDALESGVIPRQDLDHAVADIAYRLNAEHYGSKELAALAWLVANRTSSARCCVKPTTAWCKAGGLRYPDHTGL